MKRFKKVGEINKDELALHAKYIAGLLDGEGAFMIKFTAGKKRPHFQPVLVLTMDHEETIRFVADKFRVSSAPISKTRYRTLVSEEDGIKKILTILLPSLITKKRQAELILKLIRMKQNFSGTKEALKDLLLKQAEIHIEVGRLHTKGPRFDENKFRKQFEEAMQKM